MAKGGSVVRFRRELLEAEMRGEAGLAELPDRRARPDVEAAFLRGELSSALSANFRTTYKYFKLTHVSVFPR